MSKLTKGENRWSDEELIEDVQIVAEIADDVPSLRQYREHGTMSFTTLRQRFGSWPDALEAAGFEPRETPDHLSQCGNAKYEDLTWDDLGPNSTDGRSGEVEHV